MTTLLIVATTVVAWSGLRLAEVGAHNLGNVAMARAVLQKNASSADSARQWLELGTPSAASLRSLTQLYLAQDQTIAAIEAGTRALALKPGDQSISYWLGQAYWLAGDKISARQVWRASGIIQGKLDRLMWLCWQFVGLGDLRSAEAALREAMDLDPTWGPAYDALASLQWGRDWQQVSWALERARAYLPEGTATWYWNVGRQHLMNGDWQAAAQALQAAANLQPTEWTLRFWADALQRSGDSVGAARVQAELDEFLHK